MKRKAFSIVIVVVFLAMVTAGCVTTGPADSASNSVSSSGEAGTSAATGEQSATPPKDSLKIAYSDNPDSLDCTKTSINISEKMMCSIYGTLLRFDENYVPQPYVAKSWEISPDGLKYTLKLRDDVKFHDGKALTSKDVVYSLKKTQESAFNGAFLAPVKEINAPDDYTVELILSSPCAPMLNILCEPLIGLFNEETYTAAGDAFAQKPISCGPYKVVEWIPENKIVLERFDDFFGGPAPIKNIEILFIPDESTKAIALENGEIDAAENIGTTDRQNIMNNPNLKFLETPSTKAYHIAINNESEKFQDVKVRQAISYAVNKKAVIDIALDGVGKEAVAIVNEMAFGFPEGFTEYPHDPEKSKALLTEAGKLNLPVEIIIRYTELGKKIAETLQADLNKGGFKCEVKIVEAGGYSDAIESANFELTVLSWADSLMDVDAIVAYRYDSKYFGWAGNWSRIKDAKLEKLLLDGRSTNDAAARKAIYKELFEYARDMAFEKPLFLPLNNIGFNKNLKINKAAATGMYYYNDWSW